MILNHDDKMIVCSCVGVPCRRIRAEVQSGAETVKAVTRACGAGTKCGACRAQIAQLVEEERASKDVGKDAACPVVTLGAKPAAA